MARVEDFLTDGDTLTVADLSNGKTHEANHNSRELKEILAEFRNGATPFSGSCWEISVCLFCPRQTASSSEAAHAARGSFVFFGRARRPSLGKNLGDDPRNRRDR